MAKDNPHKGHRERMRTRFAKSGFRDFADHEILEYLLYYVIRQGDTNRIAHDMINRCGSFAGVFSAKRANLESIDGVGPQMAAYVEMLGEFMREFRQRMNTIVIFNMNNEECRRYVTDLFWEKGTEQLYMIALDAKKRIIGNTKLCDGDFSTVEANIGMITKKAWELNAASVVLVHNHPSGVPLPSDSDIRTNHLVYGALKMMNVNMEEHIIVAGDSCVGIFEHLNAHKSTDNVKYAQ
ncbi:MAG: JAB domain-containing protein [Clostridiales bacterium]|nr:JAB domain-containing protein [Clostridiales bacterium]